MYDYCQAFHCLPQAGGLFDQDPYHLYGMTLVAAAYQEKEKADTASRTAHANFKAGRG